MEYHRRSNPGQADTSPFGKTKPSKEKGIFDFSAYGHDPRLTKLEPYRGNIKFARNYHDAVFEHELRQASSKQNPGRMDPCVKERAEKSTKTLYHYTSEEGQAGILQSRKIRQSTQTGRNDDAAFGDGVYLTSIKPNAGKIKLAYNNYDGKDEHVLGAIVEGRVDRYVKVKLDAGEAEQVKVKNRNIYRYPGNLNLGNVDSVTLGKVRNY